MQLELTLKAPLGADWSEQYCRLWLKDVSPGMPLGLTIAGAPAPFQYTGATPPAGTEILVRLGLARDETKTLVFSTAAKAATDLRTVALPLRDGASIGSSERELAIPPPEAGPEKSVAGPFCGFAGYRFESRMMGCATAFEGATLERLGDGPLFTDYRLCYAFAERRHYTLRLRCYKLDAWVEVAEYPALGHGARLTWRLNPDGAFDSILSRDSFEGESQPAVEPLVMERPRDVLCRLQMPVLGEYFVPNNRNWFAFFDSRNEARGMIGVLGLYGERWSEPVANMPELFARGGAVEWHSALVSGARHWLLYAGPVEKRYQTTEDKGQRTDDRRQKTEDRGQRTEDRRQKTEDRGQTTEGGNACEDGRFIFHRLHAEFNALRLDEHLDLTGAQIHDVSCWNKPGVFGLDYRERARRNVATLLPLREAAQRADNLTLQALLDPQPKMHRALANDLFARFEKWVRQFQGWRKGQGDYAKNVIGFSRRLRGLLIAYELLRKDGALNEEQVGRLHSYFVFAARRILDEGRWPHSRTALHPDHPESCRDFYAYGGEHKPDRLYWTNSLPNFQSDPMCALLHLSAVIPEHPEAAHWRSFALDDLERQINAYCGKSGAWEESINYALYTLSYFIITFRIAKHRLDLDYFQDERMRRFAGWLTRFLGPLDKRWNQHTFPGIGNALCPSGGGEYLLCFASELDPDDPLRADLMAAYQRLGPGCGLIEHYPVIMAAMADVPERDYPLRPLSSEYMDELGVAMRHGQPSPQSLRASVAGGPGPRESYLFQKIGFFKDHYEADETAFNWYAKGTPLCMDYGTYTIEASVASAHNLVEIPDQDSLRRGYLEQALFSAFADYTHCEMPVTLKLLWGRGRSFEEVDAADGLVTWEKTPYYYIGDDNPVGPKTWKTRLLLFVKPDYVALFDRVYGDVPHRFCLHVVGDRLRREGALLKADGRFDLDLLGLVQHPAEFDAQTGALVPRRAGDNEEARRAHAQSWFRIYNRKDGIYRTVLFARERSRAVTLAPEGPYGIRVTTPEYTDYVFLHNEPVETRVDGAYFAGRVGWIRREAGGAVRAVVPDGRGIAAFGLTLDGRGPWVYNEDDRAAIRLAGGAPRVVRVGGE